MDSHGVPEFLKLDPKSIIPRHAQLEERVIGAIRDGHLRAGDPLPPERELAQSLNISRMTVRNSLVRLRERGFLRSQVGKGWCVGSAKIEQKLSQLIGFSVQMRGLGMTVESIVLEFKKTRAAGDQADDLGLAGQWVYLLDRLRIVAGEPLAIDRVRVVERLCPGLERFDFCRESLYQVLQEEYGLKLARAVQVVEASAAESSEAELLQIVDKSPVLRSARTVYTPDDQVVEFGTGVFRGDRYKYQVHLQGAAQGMGIV